MTCLDCVDKPKPPLPDRWRTIKDDCIKCVKARSRAMSADKSQIDNYVSHAYGRTGQLMVLMSYDVSKKELRLQGAPILVQRFLNHDIQGFLQRCVFDPAVSDSEESRRMRACSFKKALPLLPRKGLHRMTQDELRSFIGPLVCAYADREQPGWSDDTKRIDCWPDGLPWGNPKHGSWKVGNETPNSIFRRIITNIYHAAGREDLLQPTPLQCRGACEKCCAGGAAPYDEQLPGEEDEEVLHAGPQPDGSHLAHAHAYPPPLHSAHGHHMDEMMMGPHPLDGHQAALAAVASAPPLPTAIGLLHSSHVVHGPAMAPHSHALPAPQPPPATGSDDDQQAGKRRRVDEWMLRQD